METVRCERLVSTDCVFPSFQLRNRVIFNSSKFEIDLCNFYGRVLKRLFTNSGLDFFKIHSSLVNIRRYKTPNDKEHDSISFNEKCDRLAYVYAYGMIHSVIMCDCFSNLLKSKISMLQKIESMDAIRLCILGGGPALEVASFIKLFSNILLTCHSNKDREPLHVYVAIIDKSIGWKEDAELIVNAAVEDLCTSSNIEIHFRFIEADLTRQFDDKITKVIKNSHIVTMVRFLSDVNDASYSNQVIPDMIGQIIESMSFTACLFFLDTSEGGLFHKMDKLIDQHQLTARIYGPRWYNGHILSTNSIQKLSNTLRHIFRNSNCTSQCKMSCTAWLKVKPVVTKVEGLYYNAENVSAKLLKGSPLSKLKKKNPKAKKRSVFQSMVNSKKWVVIRTKKTVIFEKIAVTFKKKAAIHTEIGRKNKQINERYGLKLYDFLTPYQKNMLNYL